MKRHKKTSDSSANALDPLTRWFRRAPSGGSTASGSDDSLDAFGSETKATVPAPLPVSAGVPSSGRRLMAIAAAAVLIALAVGAFLLIQPRLQPLIAEESRPGRATFDTKPTGAEVLVDGQLRGSTPLTLHLPAGHHEAVIRRNTEERVIPLEIAAGADVSHHVEFREQPSGIGKLMVSTDPPGARITIDDAAVGTSPLTIELTPAQHKVIVAKDQSTAERMVTVEPGLLTSMVFTLPAAPPVSAGWLAVSAPFDVQVLEQNEVLGTSAAARMMIPSGRHDIDFVNTTLGFREQRKIQIEPGKTASVKLDAKAAVSLNARPWADVTIDGNAAGQTPISNAMVSIGTHQIIFRHPEFGERRQTVTVTAKGPNRIGVDMTK